MDELPIDHDSFKSFKKFAIAVDRLDLHDLATMQNLFPHQSDFFKQGPQSSAVMEIVEPDINAVLCPAAAPGKVPPEGPPNDLLRNTVHLTANHLAM